MAAAVIGSMRVVLGIDSAQFEQGLNAAQKSLREAGKRMQSIGQGLTLAGATMTAAITAPFIAMAFSLAKSGGEARNAVGQVEAALKSMGSASGKNIQTLKEQAIALRGISVFDDDDIMTKVTANMLTFGNVTGEAFDRAQLAAVNLSARMGGDLQASALMVGKALNSPVQGLAAMRRVGIQFTDAQEKQIKSMVKAGDVAGAQALMLKELERQFGGAAKAMRDADPWADTRDSWRDMEGTLEDIALRVLPPLIAAFTGLIDVFNTMPPGMQQIAVGGVAVLAALGPIITVMGTLTTATGGVIGMLSKMNIGAAGAAGGSTRLASAMGGLRAAMLFLVTTPWGLLITGIAVAVGLLVARSREATPAQKALEQATDGLTKATQDYENAVVLANTATGEAKVAAMDQVRALRVVQEEKRRTAVRALQLAKAELAQAAASRAAFNSRLSNAGEGMGTFARVSSRGPATMGENQRRGLEDAAKTLEGRIADADAAINRIEAGMNAPLGGGGGGSEDADPSGSSRARQSADQAAEEAKQRARTVEDMRYAVELEEAQLQDNRDKVRELEREDSVRQRTRSLIDAGIVKDEAAAKKEAETTQARLDAALEEQGLREDKVARRQKELELWGIDERGDMIKKIEREIQLEERIAFWREHNKDLVTATAMAMSEMAEYDQARAAAAERSAKAAAAQQEIELARLRGDDLAVRRLSRAADVDARMKDYQTGPQAMSPDDARKRAEADVAALDDAELQGKFRDFVKDGWRAAMDGDLQGFAQSWVEKWASQGLENALNSLGDLLMSLFKNVNWGGTGSGGGGFDLAAIGSSIASFFGSTPGFATGGTGKVGGSGGVDSKLINIRATPGELIDIRKPGQDAGAAGGWIAQIVPSPYFSVEVQRVAAPMVMQGAVAATEYSAKSIPRQMAQSGRQKFRGGF